MFFLLEDQHRSSRGERLLALYYVLSLFYSNDDSNALLPWEFICKLPLLDSEIGNSGTTFPLHLHSPSIDLREVHRLSAALNTTFNATMTMFWPLAMLDLDTLRQENAAIN